MSKWFYLLLLLSSGAFSDELFHYEKYDNDILFRSAVNNLVLPGMDFEKVNRVLAIEGVHVEINNKDKNISRYRYDYKSSRWWMLFSYQHWIVVVHVDSKTNKVMLVRTNYGITGL